MVSPRHAKNMVLCYIIVQVGKDLQDQIKLSITHHHHVHHQTMSPGATSTLLLRFSLFLGQSDSVPDHPFSAGIFLNIQCFSCGR